MKKLFIYMTLLFTLIGCSWDSEESRLISFWPFSFDISNNFTTVDQTFSIKDYQVLESYNKVKNAGSSKESLIIFEYSSSYPNNEEKFFTIVSDKFKRQIPGANILEKAKFKKKQGNIYYFTYEVFDNLFADSDSNADYYGVQAYLFDSKKRLYTIAYTSQSKEALNNMLDNIKDLKVN